MLNLKIARIVLLTIIVITVLVMINFFAGSSLINKEDYEAKVKQIENPAGPAKGTSVLDDLQSADSLALGVDSVALSAKNIISRETEKVKLNLMEKLVYFKTDIALVWGYILLIISILIALLFPLVNMFARPTNLGRSLLVLVGIAALIGLAFLIAPGKPMQIVGYTGTVTSNTMALRWIDTGLFFSYFMLTLAILAIIVSEIVSSLK